MSNVYMQEPPTSGKIILRTTHGDLEIELWTKETPRTCRNFIQLCMEGYYDGTIFHRIVKGFMIQGGDPEGTGLGGQSIYGAPFNDEFHSRLRFNHRGIVAMWNENKPNNNRSQFFITLDQCPWLDRKHTIFGKVVGDTLYNLMAMGDEDVDENERPLNPPRIKSCEIVLNPLDDIFPRDLPKKQVAKPPAKPKPKRPVDNMSLLSFADAEDFDAPKAVSTKKLLSSHDALNDPTLSKEYAVSPEVLAKERERLKQAEAKKEKLKQEINERKKPMPDEVEKTTTEVAKPAPVEENEPKEKEAYTKFDEKMKAMLLRKRRLMDDIRKVNEEDLDEVEGEDSSPVVKGDDKRRTARGLVQKTRGVDLEPEESESGSESNEDEFLTAEQKESLKKTRDEYAKLKMDVIKFKKVKIGTAPDETIDITKPLTMLEMQRLPFAKNKGKVRRREKDTLEKLEKFKEQLRSRQVKTDEENWMNNKLKFHIDSERAYGLQKAYNLAASNTQLSKLQTEQPKERKPKEEEESAGKKAEIDINEVLAHVKKP